MADALHDPDDTPRRAIRTVAVIPARMASTRFPGKPLANLTGRPMIQHVVERARLCVCLDDVVVATDDDRIADAVRAFGCAVVMTSPDHPNGTSRIAEATRNIDADLIVNIQGDEPEVEPMLVDAAVEALLGDPAASVSTAASPFLPNEDPTDRRLVKVVVGISGRALYFSRSLIPCNRDARPDGVAPLRHVGLYVYRRDFLAHYARLPESPLERTEMLEQLRILEHGHHIAVAVGESRSQGIDTPEQYESWARRWLAEQG